LFHAGLPLHGGYVGVDIFFVISGFLISSLLLREVERTGTISLWSFYARRAKRLLPATFVVLLASLACTWALAPAAQKSTFALDSAFAAGYIANLHFAERAVDYLAEDVGPSPVLHFWSLSVEEQFYFCWPLLILVGVWLARRTHKRIEIGALLILTLVVVPSFVWSLTFSTQKPAAAFFVTSTRLWELGVGAMLALATPLLPLPNRRLSEAAGLLGLLFIGLSLAMFGHGTTWP